ncbi:MAG TPA: hypothetical protein VK162_00870 [Streptosporangiaceae bacterium]|nr:hypothetical protein [Streptosporangiaceae bacterium]
MSHSAAVEFEAMTQALLMKGQDYAAFNAAAAGRGANAAFHKTDSAQPMALGCGYVTPPCEC